MKRRIHTTIATLLAIVAVGAVVAPVASAKPPKPGSTQLTKAQQCANLKSAYDIHYDYAQQARAAGDWELYHKLMGYAGATAEAALNLRCDWAISGKYRIAETQATSDPVLDAPLLTVR